MKEKNELAIIPPKKVTIELAPAQLAKVMESEAKKRVLITRYIGHHMKSGTDFGTIAINGRESKPSLFKPGSEKFLSLFKLIARFEKDTETWEMAGSKAGVFAYRCLLIASNGNVVGEGRGVSTLDEKRWSINNAVKIAEKRAQIDAVLRTGSLSDFFTQDLEDLPPADRASMKSYSVAETEDRSPTDPVIEQKGKIMWLLKELGEDISSRKAIGESVKKLTGLELIEDVYTDIVTRLESIYEETKSEDRTIT